MLTRRHVLSGAAGLGGASLLSRAGGQASPGRGLGPPPEPGTGRVVSVDLIAAERPTALPGFGGHALPLWTFTDGAWPTLIRLNLGDRLKVSLENRLPREDEITSIHWHGIRLPNDQDGVPYLVQQPVAPGGRRGYSFTPPDTGTYFFHTHCDTVEQLGRGLQGVLIVDGDTTAPHDADIPLVLRDWRVDEDTEHFTSFSTLRGAGRAGTYGPLRTVNGARDPAITLPAHGDCRLRLINTDPTRIMDIAVEQADAAIIAIDGVAVPPFPLSSWMLGPGMRIDVVLRAPKEGGVARLIDRSAEGHVQLAHFAGAASAMRSRGFDPAPLRRARIPVPDLSAAKRLTFSLESSVSGAAQMALDDRFGPAIGALCVSARNFWTINGLPWPDHDHARLPPPLAVLDRGQSYIFTFRNTSDFSHPIHLHGHFFSFLRSDKLQRPPHHTDTLLLLPQETAEVALVADNPGDWMLHCHVIEHQENGMMAYLRVT